MILPGALRAIDEIPVVSHASFPLIPAFSLGEKENWVPSLVHIGVCGFPLAFRAV